MARESITAGSTAGGTRRAAQHYGRRTNEDKYPAKHHQRHGEELFEVTFRYDDLPAYGTDLLIQSIPANAVILEASLQVTTAFAGGTSLAIGLAESDGTEIDLDGFVTDAQAPLANIDAVADYIEGAGALVGVAIGPAAGQLVVTATGTFTAGEGTILVKYRKLVDKSDQFNDDI